MLSHVAQTLVHSVKVFQPTKNHWKNIMKRISFMLILLKEATYSELHRFWNELAGKLSPTLYCNISVLQFDKT